MLDRLVTGLELVHDSDDLGYRRDGDTDRWRLVKRL
jgi:hypothetical protein